MNGDEVFQTYSAPYYTPTSVTQAYHAIPRFGRTSAISSIASFDNTDQTDYAMGLIFITSVVLCFFLFWTVTLFVFACMGPDQVGFLAGRGFVQPVPNNNDTYDDYKHVAYRRPRRVRITFLTCSVLVTLFSILFVTNGLSNVEEMQSTLLKSNSDIRDLTSRGEDIAKQLEIVGDAAAPIRDELVGRLGNFCPADPSLVQATGYDFDGMAAEGIEYLNILSDFVNNDVSDMRDVLRQINDATNEVSRFINTYDVSDPMAMAFVIPTIVLTMMLVFAVSLAWCRYSPGWLDCALKWAIIPLFGIAIVFSWVCVSLFGLATTANADACSGGNPPSPDGTIMEILAEQGYDNPDSLVFQAIRYYIEGCRSPFPFAFLGQYLDELGLAMNSTDILRNSVDAIGISELESRCGTDFLTINYLLDDVADKLVVLSDSADLTFDLISCRSINPVYVNTFHKAACEESTSGLSWMFASLLVIAVCGMTMLTLRSAVYEEITLNEYGDMADLQLVQDGNSDGKSEAAYNLRSRKSASGSRRSSTSKDPPPPEQFARTMPSQTQSGSGDDDYVYPPVVLKASRS